MKIYQLKNGNIEVITKEHKDGTKEGFVIRMDEHPTAKIQVAISYCKTYYSGEKHKCEKCKNEKNYDEYRAWEVEQE